MTVSDRPGDEVRGERIVCIFRKEGTRTIVPQTGGHRATCLIIKGLPARAVIEMPWRGL
ncbi:MAG: hypothetical protein HY369_01235 [Candidatus Aenigmarchaeota archaeon]|nr:hypothetical protein [Candidatus Aenigmarchaeota archaeon]